MTENHIPGTIIGLYPATPMTQARAESVRDANNESDSDSIYSARYNCGAWYVDVFERDTGEQIGTL